MSNTLKSGLITTLGTNIGDDFIRAGVCLLLEKYYQGRSIVYTAINKHEPFSVYPDWHPVKLARRMTALSRSLQRVSVFIEGKVVSLCGTQFDGCSFIIQCGAPVFWPGCSTCEWAKPLWHDVIGRLHRRIPVLNLAAGSCYPWESYPGIDVSAADQTYIKDIINYCRLTTVRDVAAQEICHSLNYHAPLLPCTAFLAASGQRAELAENAPILINYMAGGGHFEFGQNIDAEGWRQTVLELVRRLKQRHRLRFLCHDKNELRLARELAPHIDCLLPETVEEYWRVAKDAKLALCNRMHASVGMAGMGIPSIAICTDTRLLMATQIGLPTAYIKDVSSASLEDAIETLLGRRKTERERLLALQERTFSNYLELLADRLPG